MQDTNEVDLREKLVNFEFIFRDSGCGISAENQQKLFMNFSKLAETEQANRSGVGLGLSICKEIINAHGGSVDIMSEEGKGTDFIIKLKSRCRVDENRIKRAQQKIENGESISSSDQSQNQGNDQ